MYLYTETCFNYLYTTIGLKYEDQEYTLAC